jgi:hypothetical protein
MPAKVEKVSIPKHTPHPGPLERRPGARLHPLAVPGAFRRLLDEALHRPDLRERLLRHARGLGDPVLHAGGHVPEPAAEHERSADHDWRHQQRGQREPGLQPGEEHDAAHECQHLARELRDLVAQHRLQHPDVDRQPAGELARAALGEEAGRHVQQTAEQLPAEPGDGLLAGRAQQVGLGVVEHGLHGEERYQRQRDAVEQRPVMPHERRVEQVAHHHREGEAGHAAEHQRDARTEQQVAIRSDPRPQPDEPARPGNARHGCTCAAAGNAICSPGWPRMITLPAGSG